MADKREEPALDVRVRDGLTIAVPSNLSAITTYVLLEQEAWFEKEISFLQSFLKPGMKAIDIGANLGVYSLHMAKMTGPNGRVFAYEPGGEARALLERSRELNDLGNLKIIGAALSDHAREGSLAFAASSELRALSSTSRGERVSVVTLDVEDTVRDWSPPDFIKVDAEGEEERIIAGGAGFFARHSPLVMFEIKAGDAVNERLRSIFPAIGYRLFRQLGGAPILVPDDPRQPLDGYELNLFAAKPDRAESLSQRGLLVDAVADWKPGEAARQEAISTWRRQNFASLVDTSRGFGAVADGGYRDSLAAYATWRSSGQPIAIRCAALAFAVHGLRMVCARAPNVERLSTFVRAASDWGARGESVAGLRDLFQTLERGSVAIREPFWPASASLEDAATGQRLVDWFVGSAAAQYERTSSFSSTFSGGSPVLPWLCRHPFTGTEMERRRVLLAARSGQQPKVPARLCADAPDHLNADIWRAGLVPGTSAEGQRRRS